MDAVHVDAQDVLLERLVEQLLDQDDNYKQYCKDNEEASTKGREIDDEWTRVKDQLNILKDHLQNAAEEDKGDLQAKVQAYKDKSKDLWLQKEKFKAQKMQSRAASEGARSKIRRRILNDADVILSTLSASGHDLLSESNFVFPTVIIDEACQSVELSTLIPLQYRAEKVILVGDPKQLPPTVLSRASKGFHYEQSLFQRILNLNPKSSMLLSIQYRMHPEISKFPSLRFYENKIFDAVGLGEKCFAPWHRDSSLGPYRFFDVHQGREQRSRYGQSISNPQECRAALDLVLYLCRMNPNDNVRVPFYCSFVILITGSPR